MTDPTEDDGGRSIEERASDEQAELFEGGILEGDKLTRSTIGNAMGPAKNHVELAVKMTGAEVALRDGMLHPNKLVNLLVTCEPIAHAEKYQLEKPPDGGLKRKLLGAKVVQEVRPVFTEAVGHDFADACPRFFGKAIEQDAQAAAKALDVMNRMMTEYMREGEATAA